MKASLPAAEEARWDFACGVVMMGRSVGRGGGGLVWDEMGGEEKMRRMRRGKEGVNG